MDYREFSQKKSYLCSSFDTTVSKIDLEYQYRIDIQVWIPEYRYKSIDY